MKISRTHSHKGDKKLQVRVGANDSCLENIIPNDEKHPHRLATEYFRGRLIFRVKDFDNAELQDESGYFTDHRRVFSLQIHGEFLAELSGNDLVWYCKFDNPIKVPNIFITFFNMIAPQAQHDLGGERPFIQSFALTTSSAIKGWGKLAHEFPCRIEEDVKELLPPYLEIKKPWTLIMSHEDAMVHARRKFFSHEENRKAVIFKPHQTVSNNWIIIGFEIFSNLFDPKTFRLNISHIPGTHIDMHSVVNEQPIKLILQTKDGAIQFLCLELSLV